MTMTCEELARELANALMMIDQIACYPAEVAPAYVGNWPGLVDHIHERALEAVRAYEALTGELMRGDEPRWRVAVEDGA